MSTEAINRTRADVADASDRDERARRAVRVFRSMQFGLTSYARAITGNPKVRVEISSGPPRTDGNLILYRPPLALGDNTPHDRMWCDKRGENSLKVCPACALREEVLVNIYHEIAHIAYGSFDQTTDAARLKAIDVAIKEWGGEYEARIRETIRESSVVAQTYFGLATLISPFLPYLYNCIEDARVDLAMFDTRKGTRKMLQADTFNILREGIPDKDGVLQSWADAPLNSQASLACYLHAAGYGGWQELLHPKVAEDFTDTRLLEILHDVRSASSAEDTYKIAFPVLARLRELGYFKLDDEENDEPDQSGDFGGDFSEESDRDTQSPPDEGSEADPDSTTGPDGGTADMEGVEASSREGDGSPESGTEEDESDTESDGSSEGENGVDDPQGDDSSSEEDAPQGGEPSPDGDQQDEQETDSSGDVHESGDSEDEASSSGEGSDGEDHDSEGAGGDDSDSREDTEGELNADQDGVSSEPGGEPGVQGDERDPSSDVGQGSTLDADEEATDSADQDGSDLDPRSDSEEGDDLGQDLDISSDSESSSDPTNGNQLDDREGDQQEGEESATSEADSSTEKSSEPESSDSSGDGTLDRESEDDDDRTVEPLDSGADQGLGGAKVDLPEYGDADDVQSAIEHTHPETVAEANETSADQRAVDVAVIQGMYFETPSVGVAGVVEHFWSPDELNWDSSTLPDHVRVELGITCDMEIPESILSPILLKTRRIFNDNKASEYQPNLRSGRVNSKVLGRRAWNGDDRLFGKRRVPGKRDYAVMIGLDISGSNRGRNIALVKRAVQAQAELLSRVGVPFSIVAHSALGDVDDMFVTDGYVMHLHHIKDWTEPWSNAVQDRLATLKAFGGNLDGHAMEYMRNRLGKVEATDKILLYYTDGKMPAANAEEELEVLQRQIRLCRRDQITLLGVGIRTNSPVRHGLDTVQVDTDEDLKTVVEHLGRRLLRRAR